MASLQPTQHQSEDEPQRTTPRKSPVRVRSAALAMMRVPHEGLLRVDRSRVNIFRREALVGALMLATDDRPSEPELGMLAGWSRSGCRTNYESFLCWPEDCRAEWIAAVRRCVDEGPQIAADRLRPWWMDQILNRDSSGIVRAWRALGTAALL